MEAEMAKIIEAYAEAHTDDVSPLLDELVTETGKTHRVFPLEYR